MAAVLAALALLSCIAFWSQWRHQDELNWHREDVRLGTSMEIYSSSRGCFHRERTKTSWKQNGEVYQYKGHERSQAAMVALRRAILDTRTKTSTLDQFERVPKPVKILNRSEDLAPWAAGPLPDLTPQEVESDLAAYLTKDPGHSTSHLSFEVSLGGEPRIYLEYRHKYALSSSSYFGFLSPPRTWSVTVGDESWNTSSTKISRLLYPWSIQTRHCLQDTLDWPESYTEVKAQQLAWQRVGVHLLESQQDWLGSDSDLHFQGLEFSSSSGLLATYTAKVLISGVVYDVRWRFEPSTRPSVNWKAVSELLEADQGKSVKNCYLFIHMDNSPILVPAT